MFFLSLLPLGAHGGYSRPGMKSHGTSSSSKAEAVGMALWAFLFLFSCPLPFFGGLPASGPIGCDISSSGQYRWPGTRRSASWINLEFAQSRAVQASAIDSSSSSSLPSSRSNHIASYVLRQQVDFHWPRSSLTLFNNKYQT